MIINDYCLMRVVPLSSAQKQLFRLIKLTFKKIKIFTL